MRSLSVLRMRGVSFLGRMRSLSLFEGEGFVAFEENEELCRFLKKAPQKLQSG